ncbi:putative tegumental protein [Schistosoma japonicum]|uniref:Putative tegumental protein n=1 Tax=Schistosoma japonicum TaxID=6182 RepID=A0A4Z2DKK3_SCHJA|nr:Tegumental antigen [Schistosoma japonicum]KAH8868255.1 Tegumental antigen [Schistosoma japonicum]TNN16918.1 putative tegumental protein [Schistosoma japonicum]
MGEPGVLHAFSLIDTDNDGIITTEDLERYSKKSTVADDFVSKWQKLFDENNTGEITFYHFCDVLGVSKNKRDEILKERNIVISDNRPKPVVYSSNLDPEMQQKILRLIKACWNKQNDVSSLHHVTVRCDNEFGPRWRGRATQDTNPLPQAAKRKYMVFSCDGGETKSCLWLEEESKDRPGGCCCC